MGHTLTEWQNKVLALVHDTSSKDLSPAEVSDSGLRPAVMRYSLDRPRILVTEAAGAGSAYLSLPAGWVAGFSRLSVIEYPARQNPPNLLDSDVWRVTRSVADPTVEQILLLNDIPTAAEYVRLSFTVPWPFPTATAADDKLDDVAYEAVAHLAAAYCLEALAAEAARDRSGALPTDFAGGRDRVGMLGAAAKAKKDVYQSFLGFLSGSVKVGSIRIRSSLGA